MNKQLIAERFTKAIATYPQEANVQRQIADKMIHLLTEHLPSPCPKVIEFGCGTGIYSRMLFQTLHPEMLLLNDLCPEMKYCCEDGSNLPKTFSRDVTRCSTNKAISLSAPLAKRI